MDVSSPIWTTIGAGALQRINTLNRPLAQNIADRKCIKGESGMYVDGQTIITAGAILSALLLLGGILFKVYKWYLKQQDQDSEIQHIKKENRLIVEALYACLDGMEQLGANHTVPETKKKLNDHLNNIAHE